MQANIHALIIIYVYFDVLGQMQRTSVPGLDTSQIGTYHVIGFACRHPLGEFARVIGIKLPAGLLLRQLPDGYLNPVYGAIVRSPDGAKNQSIRISRLQLFFGGIGLVYDTQAANGEEKNRQE